VLLEYSLGKDRSYLWAVTPTEMAVYELPQRAEIELAAKKYSDLLKTGNKRELRSQVKLAAAELSRMVLGPVADKLGDKRLLIVTDGALQYIPFGALVTKNDQPLIVEHEIVHLPSASALAVLRKELAGRQPASKAVAVLADPVLQENDPRIKKAGLTGRTPNAKSDGSAGSTRDANADLVRSARDAGVASLERLLYTRREAEAIAALTGADTRFKALDFDASKKTAMSPDLGQFRIVHFATHGLLNSQHPELSGIVLSLVDERGQPQDGFLRLHDIFNLKLNAEMVVLSACQTALGKNVKGEGLVGLTRGFMYAGAARVVASLWDVRDEATAELMTRFYRGMLKDNLRPAAALRAAQVSMLKDARWEAPYYWAGFVLQGEWK
ncbi:MAG: CHAT domain-containing protein, partial [Acidobacteriota bacterium]